MPETTSAIPLFERAPALARSVPYCPIGTYPSRVERVELEDAGERIPILIKRDDIAADGYAGNKVRKLEFILADARARGITRLITAGATGSHHAFATAYHGRRAGFEVSLVLFPQSLTPHVRQMLLLDAAVGAELLWATRMEMVPFGLWRARFAHRREAVCTIPPGGSSDIGTFGYVNGALELAAQIEAGSAPRPSSIHVAAGTLGTLAGIGIGAAWAGLDIPIVGTRITARLLTNERTLAALVNATLSRLRSAGATGLPEAAAVLSRITLQHDQIGAGYGRPTAAGSHATDVFAAGGLDLDTTYTAKAAAGLLAHMKAAAAAAGPASASVRQGASVPLFWHTLSAVEPHGIADHLTPADLPAHFRRYVDSG